MNKIIQIVKPFALTLGILRIKTSITNSKRETLWQFSFKNSSEKVCIIKIYHSHSKLFHTVFTLTCSFYPFGVELVTIILQLKDLYMDM